ncbi:hypothetical protein [Spirosoma agri]|uniref:Uncharacterized protein n=1 Tax=Spirosoma agri TaxID=1987381 RepID=A0A6M0IBD7_9BACT|nr:hypothetical protein [Spirosoma agri]NEU65506.1 hypothetical protein [Spirosoma agri]
MGIYNGGNDRIDQFDTCPITGLAVSYDFQMAPDLDAYEYKIPSVNPNTIVTITGAVLGEDSFAKLRPSADILEGEIATTNNERYLIDNETLTRFS